MFRRPSYVLFGLAFATAHLTACNDAGEEVANGGGTGGAGATGGSGAGGYSFNQCGVAAPLPAETGQCTAIAAPAIADFDDYAGTEPASYTFNVVAESPAEPVRGAILHVGDGSDMNGGTGVIATEMVTGEGDSGYALEISNTNSMNWGGLLMLYFPFGGATVACLDARTYEGVEFSIKGSSPSGKFGVTVGMLDTIPKADNGLCDNPTAADCKDATIQWALPADAETWLPVRIPWSALTPGIGSGTACVPVTGQNILRFVIQPFMNYPPPDYTFEAGAYTLTIDNLGFY